MIKGNEIRPNGVRRKLIKSSITALQTAADIPLFYFPHGAKILNMHVVTMVALTTANAVIDIGVAKDGDTVIDGYAVVQSTSAIGDVLDIWNTKGTNGGVIDIPVGTLLWLQTNGGPDAGSVIVECEYEDISN